MPRKIAILLLTLILFFPVIAAAGNVSPDNARNVAENWLYHVVHSFGSWGGTVSPSISGEESLVHNGVLVGYNFTVNPRGHILVSARDDIPAVKLYSENTTLSVYNGNHPEQTDWIAEEIFQLGEMIDSRNAELASADPSQNPDLEIWARFQKNPWKFEDAFLSDKAPPDAVSYGPLLTTTWAQQEPYNQECPLESSGCRSIVGCVATATSQIMKFWNYPATGQGKTFYLWNNGKQFVVLHRNFAESTYDWVNMPNSLNGTSTAAQKSAVSKLCADVGIAFHMKYGCDGSAANTSHAAKVLTKYFKYQDTAAWVNRSDYPSQSAWMQVFKTEVQAGRPSQLSIKAEEAGGHSVVVDGYRDSPSESVHINMGWSGNYDGWYTPDSFVTGSYTWSDMDRGAVIGIQPPVQPVKAQIMGLITPNHASPGETVLLSSEVKNTGSAVLPDGAAVYHYVSGPDGNDLVGSTSVAGLGAGITQWFPCNWTIPSSATIGTYSYFSVVCDINYNPISDWSTSQTFPVSTTPPNPGPQPGLWNGTNIRFNISSDGKKLTSTGSSIVLNGYRYALALGPFTFYNVGICGKVVFNIYFGGDYSITNNSFVLAAMDGTRIDGAFSSSSASTGTYSFSAYTPSCLEYLTSSGAWNAVPASAASPTDSSRIPGNVSDSDFIMVYEILPE